MEFGGVFENEPVCIEKVIECQDTDVEEVAADQVAHCQVDMTSSDRRIGYCDLRKGGRGRKEQRSDEGISQSGKLGDLFTKVWQE